MTILRVTRRQFVAALGSAAAWPLVARGQQPERVRRIGVLVNLAADDPQGQARVTAFVQALQQLGWSTDRNVRIDYRWAADHADLYRKYAAELIALAPDIILASSSPSVGALQQATRDVPIVFANVADPVGAGFVDSLARGRPIASSRARSQPICRCRGRPSTSWSSISKPRRRLALRSRRTCSPAPTRSSNEKARVHCGMLNPSSLIVLRSQ